MPAQGKKTFLFHSLHFFPLIFLGSFAACVFFRCCKHSQNFERVKRKCIRRTATKRIIKNTNPERVNIEKQGIHKCFNNNAHEKSALLPREKTNEQHAPVQAHVNRQKFVYNRDAIKFLALINNILIPSDVNRFLRRGNEKN